MKHFPFIEDWLCNVAKNTRGLKRLSTVTSLVTSKKPNTVARRFKEQRYFLSCCFNFLVTDDSFIEFENDKKYTYKTGYSYLIRVSKA